MRKLVLDANVWVSGLLFKGGIPGKLVDLVIKRQVQSFHSDPILEEVLRNVLKVSDSKEEVEIAKRVIERRSLLLEPPTRVKVITGKDSDNRILACAVEAGADMIVSRDKRHLLVLGNYKDIPIISPRDAYDRITQAESTENA